MGALLEDEYILAKTLYNHSLSRDSKNRYTRVWINEDWINGIGVIYVSTETCYPMPTDGCSPN